MRHIVFKFIIFFLFYLPIQIISAQQKSSTIQISFKVVEFCNIELINSEPNVICPHNSLYEIRRQEYDGLSYIIYF